MPDRRSAAANVAGRNRWADVVLVSAVRRMVGGRQGHPGQRPGFRGDVSQARCVYLDDAQRPGNANEPSDIQDADD